jgi:transmembrane sensor
MNLTSFPDMEAVREDAALWVARLDRGLSPAEQAELRQWLRSAAHRRAFEELRDVWESMDVLSVLGEVLPRRAPRRARRWSGAAWAAGVAAAGVLAVAVFRPWSSTEVAQPARPAVAARLDAFATAVGEQRTVTLRDGSLLSLNTDSLVEASFVDNQRRLFLLRGEAHFEVAHDTTRPFVVSVGAHAVRAVGTAFNIRLRADSSADVLVTSGTVRVDAAVAAAEPAAMVTAGELLQLRRDGSSQLLQLDAAAIESRLAWRRSVLIFDGDTLADVVAEVSRYSARPLRLADPAVGRMRIVGYFPSSDLQSLLRTLHANFGIEAEDDGAEIVLTARSDKPTPD